jgi:MFS transporter, FHS family, glucose/mannose:H+ symporter
VTQTIRRGILFVGAATGMFVFGIVMAVLGTLFGLPEMRARLQIDLAQQGNLLVLLYVGILIATLVVGPAIDKIGTKMILTGSASLVAAGMLGFAFAHSYAASAVPAVLLGWGGGGLNISATALVSDLYDERRGPMLNILGIFYGIGALCIPLLAASIAAFFSIQLQLICCAGLAVGCALLYLMLRFPPAAEAKGFSWRNALQVARYPGVLVVAFLLFCESGNEGSIAGWTSTYAGTAGFPARTATFILAAYWAALMLGRFIVAQLLKFMSKEWLVLVSGIGALLGAALLVANRSTLMFGVGVLVLGFSYAGVFPTVLAIAGDSYKKFAGSVFGFVFGIALLGGMSFPWAVGQFSQKWGVRYGMVVPLIGAAAICVFAWRILSVSRGRTQVSVVSEIDAR